MLVNSKFKKQDGKKWKIWNLKQPQTKKCLKRSDQRELVGAASERANRNSSIKIDSWDRSEEGIW